MTRRELKDLLRGSFALVEVQDAEWWVRVTHAEILDLHRHAGDALKHIGPDVDGEISFHVEWPD